MRQWTASHLFWWRQTWHLFVRCSSVQASIAILSDCFSTCFAMFAIISWTRVCCLICCLDFPWESARYKRDSKHPCCNLVKNDARGDQRIREASKVTMYDDVWSTIHLKRRLWTAVCVNMNVWHGNNYMLQIRLGSLVVLKCPHHTNQSLICFNSHKCLLRLNVGTMHPLTADGFPQMSMVLRVLPASPASAAESKGYWRAIWIKHVTAHWWSLGV